MNLMFGLEETVGFKTKRERILMELFDVYPLYPIEPVKALGSKLWDKNGTEYLDLYGGHAVISIGHSHPTYVERVTTQIQKIGFYSNAVENSLQKELALKMGHDLRLL